MDVNKTNYEAYILDYLEGELEGEAHNQVHEFLEQHPEIHEEVKDLLTYQLPKEEKVYPYKPSLYKSNNRTFTLPLGITGIAASLLLFVSFFLLKNVKEQNSANKHEQTTPTQLAESSTNETQSTKELSAQEERTRPLLQNEKPKIVEQNGQQVLLASQKNHKDSTSQNSEKKADVNFALYQPVDVEVELPNNRQPNNVKQVIDTPSQLPQNAINSETEQLPVEEKLPVKVKPVDPLPMPEVAEKKIEDDGFEIESFPQETAIAFTPVEDNDPFSTTDKKSALIHTGEALLNVLVDDDKELKESLVPMSFGGFTITKTKKEKEEKKEKKKKN